MIKLIHGECLSEMAKLPDQSVDMVMCDLPYGTTQNKWDAVIDPVEMWRQYKRICKGAVVLTSAQPFTSILVCSNLEDFNHSWVWHKSRATGHLNAKKQPMRATEDVLVFKPNGVGTYNPQGLRQKEVPTIRFGREGNGTNYGDSAKDALQTHEGYPTNLLYFPSEGNNDHPTQKPVYLMEYLIRTFTNEGDIVLDNCVGSGTSGVAAVGSRRGFIGIEQDPEYFKLAKKRINKSALGLFSGVPVDDLEELFA